MGLASLDAALSGLRASQKQISVISNNVSNATTPGYTRKLLPQYSQSIAGETVGVVPGTIIRQVDLNLERDLWTQISAVGAAEVRQTYLSGIEEFHGPPDAELSVAAEISRLKDSFAALSDSPDDAFLLSETVEQAQKTASKFNDLADLIITSRNDVQSDIQSTVNRINQLLEQIANLNDQVQDNLNISRSTAASEDKRDDAIKELTELMGVSFFVRGDGVMVVQSEDGVELASTTANRIEFNDIPVSSNTYYPEADIGLYVVNRQFTGTPSTDPTAINITERRLGGRLGGLIQLRDTDLPQAEAQLDELAHKMAMRFEAQGLMLYTDASGSVPLDTPPDPAALPAPGTPVEYIGFAASMRVNSDILSDHSLLRSGTYGATDIPSGSNEIISRVVEYTFGSTDYQLAANEDAATQVDLLNLPGGVNDLQTWLGLTSSNSFDGFRDITTFVDPDGAGPLTSIDNLVASANGDLDDPNDQFTITFDDPRMVPAPVPFTVTIDLSAVPQTGANAAQDIVNEINNQLAGADPRFSAVAAIGGNNQITINATSNFDIDASAANGMGQTGLNYIGLSEGSYTTSDPYFDIAVGENDLTRITIEPGDDLAALVTKLQNVDGLAVSPDTLVDGILRIRPGEDYDNPDYGGALRVIAGPFETSGAAYADSVATTGTRASIHDGVNIASAFFGTYTGTGVPGDPVNNFSPVADYRYQSETTNGSGTFVAFRSANLGPGLDVSTGLTGATQLIDYAQKMVNFNAQQINNIENGKADDESLRDILQTQLDSESGVNIDEELANLIVYQTAFSASARVVNAVDELFQELLNAV